MKFFGKEFAKAFFIGFLIFLVLMAITYIAEGSLGTPKEILINFAYNQLYSVVLYLVNVPLFRYFLKTHKTDFFKPKNLLISFLGAVLSTLIGLFALQVFFNVVINGKDFLEFLSEQKIDYYYVAFIIAMVVTIIFYITFYYRFKQENKVAEQKIIAGTASAKFDALKNQLDPHFLFNSLNVLTSLIEENPEAATRFTTSLSKVYRYVLEQKNKELVPLEEELKFAELYMSLLAVRFEDSIVFSMPSSLNNPQAKVVPLSLQLLLENAVKHNQVMPSKKLHINIFEENGVLVVANNRQPKQVLRESTGVGLRNIRDRYSLLTKSPVSIHETRTEFRVAIPMLDENLKILNKSETFISEKKYKLAKKRVEKLKVFYIHFGIYCLCVPFLIYLNFLSRAGFPWALFPIVGWGIGIASHASETFNYNPFFGKKWEERKIRELMDKED
ncbi:histidine kinase [Vitellibacter sp. q18]|nr:histidine kinase [Aequorivita lutea]